MAQIILSPQTYGVLSDAIKCREFDHLEFDGGAKYYCSFHSERMLITMDILRYANVRCILSANGVVYSVKVTNRQISDIIGNDRTRFGCFGVNQNSTYECKICVHKRDYGNVLRLIG